MALATLSAIGSGATDQLLAEVVHALEQDAFRIAGALRIQVHNAARTSCNSDLRLLPEGPVVRITQDLGTGSTACRMDAGALEKAVALAQTSLATHGADLVILNKFGLSEAEGRGFRPLIADAIERDIPVLLGLSDTHRAAFETFAGDMATSLPPEAPTVIAWCRAAIHRNEPNSA